MKIVVTGAAGLIGYEVVHALARVGHEVIALGRAQRREDQRFPASRVVVDLSSADATRALGVLAPELIVHAAAVLPPRFFGNDATDAARANRAMDDSVLAAAESIGCNVVYLSGTSLYGCVDYLCTEDSPIRPRGPYLDEKHRTEARVLDLLNGGVVLRVSSPYGARQRAATVLQRFIERASRGEDLLFFGSGAREQDFIAVEDIAASTVSAAASERRGVFNIASAHPVAMRDLAVLVTEIVSTGRSRVRPAGVDDPEEACRARIAITKAQRELGWRPAVALDVGIRRLAEYLATRRGTVPTNSPMPSP